jgi:predicted esterase
MNGEVPDELDYDDETDSDLESRLEELESRIEEVEQSQTRASNSAISAGYCVGAALATVLSWSSHHAVALAAFHGLCSWFYVAYYVATRWAEVKFF